MLAGMSPEGQPADSPTIKKPASTGDTGEHDQQRASLSFQSPEMQPMQTPYVPNKQQIRRACASIRRTWSPEVEYVRRTGSPLWTDIGVAAPAFTVNYSSRGPLVQAVVPLGDDPWGDQ